MIDKFGAGASLLALVVGSAALAQDRTAEDGTIDEIVVTAQKRPQTVLETPISLTAFGGEFLEDKKVDTVADVATFAPNFQTFTGGSQTNAKLGIRGVTSVGVFIDGVYYPRPGRSSATWWTSNRSRCCAVRKARCSGGTRPSVR